MIVPYHVAVDCESLLVLDLGALQIVAGFVRCAMERDSRLEFEYIEWLFFEKLKSTQSCIEKAV